MSRSRVVDLYRMLVSPNGAQMKQGDVVLIWGATGGRRRVRVPVRAERRGHPVGGVSSSDKVDLLHEIGVEYAIDRRARATSLGTATVRIRKSSGASARRSVSSPARTPTSCSSTPASRPSEPASSS